MPKIRSKHGYAEVPLPGQVYVFNIDSKGRHVAQVSSTKHVQLLLAAGTYEICKDDDDAAPATGPDLDTLRAHLMNAVAPKLIERPAANGERRYWVADNWPETTAVPEHIITKAKLPGCALIDPDKRLRLVTLNGSAIYAFLGSLESAGTEWRLFQLLPGSTIDLAAIPSADAINSGTDPDDEGDTEEGADGADEGDDQDGENGDDNAGNQSQQSAPPPPTTPQLIDVKGIGPTMVKKLAEQGVTTLDQLAALTKEQADALDDKLKAHGAIARDGWVAQAWKLIQDYAALASA